MVGTHAETKKTLKQLVVLKYPNFLLKLGSKYSFALQVASEYLDPAQVPPVKSAPE